MVSILLVDDSVTMRKMVAYTLTCVGHMVQQAGDGDEALRVISSQPADLIITDINMPKMDGIALIKALRLLPDYQSTPILVLTTEIDASKKNQAKQAGATAWIEKPFDPDDLLSIIDRVL